ncbi:RluA family pseudouridine synthase [Paenibacillus endoradicis]|uniref:RluA family pseudouridine synthase n=1 Tax=Paenibacillus endoradicis TaxID=2972487 RepID=UPI00215955D5|nr:RluA family pseudouridine synthase [Paenibacillus endoradicis]MCR8656023.1 RluA family pseudouridine synthase [Paenibacillus endoradicis]MCR8658349.1 RluA family pseudouridine synthase [Paenibacillus endoradicis]
MSNITEQQENYEFIANDESQGIRIDKFVTDSIDNAAISRTQVQEWIKTAHVQVNGTVIKSNYKVQENDTITVQVPETQALEIIAENIPLEVIYEDSDVIVINKPRGMVVHPAPGHPKGTLVNALMHHCKDLSGINGVLRPGIVHRIDRDTTGLLMVAKNDLAHVSLAEQLKEHSVTRRYTALVHGNMPHDSGSIDAPIGRDSNDRKLYTVTDVNAKDAITHFTVVERIGGDYTIVELQLETGRTHQIRVHMKYIGYPLAGDPVYGRNKTIPLKGQALHAGILGFTHPRTGERLQFEVPLPDDFNEILINLRSR